MSGPRVDGHAPSGKIPASRRSTTTRRSTPSSPRIIHRRRESASQSFFARLNMNESSAYVPPKVWIWDKPSGGQFANINRPVAGPTHDKDLPIGRHPLQLYSLGTPNDVKVTPYLVRLGSAGTGKPTATGCFV